MFIKHQYFNLPSKTPELEKIKIFEDALREIAPIKIEEVANQLELLISQKKQQLEALKKSKRRGELNPDDEWFCLSLINYEYAEFYVAQRWLRYWLDIQLYIAPETIPTQHINPEIKLLSEKFNNAKEYPIENIYSGELRGKGSQLMGLCPFHEERTPSFIIYTNENRFHCFGCQKNGDSIDFYMLKEDVSFGEALNLLCHK